MACTLHLGPCTERAHWAAAALAALPFLSDEGWGIYETGGGDTATDASAERDQFQLQREDCPDEGEPRFDDDVDAWHHVVACAAAGNPGHVATLAFLARFSPGELRNIFVQLYGGH